MTTTAGERLDAMTRPPGRHTVTWTISNIGAVHGTVHCLTPDALCHHPCGHELDACEGHPHDWVSDCAIAQSIDIVGTVDCYDGPDDAPLRDGEIAAEWHGGGFSWRYAEEREYALYPQDRPELLGHPHPWFLYDWIYDVLSDDNQNTGYTFDTLEEAVCATDDLGPGWTITRRPIGPRETVNPADITAIRKQWAAEERAAEIAAGEEHP